ncbi:retrotransposable element Tf2, partial [Tanacetum coccineum]
PMGGHSGVRVTTHSICALLYLKKIRKHVKQFIRECHVCQTNKHDLMAYPRLLQPLPIPDKVWSSISMDFIEGLPMSKGKSNVMVVVDRLSKYSHFILLSHPFTSIQVAQAFLDNIYKLHGLPKDIVSDLDKVFLSKLWHELFKLLDVSLHMSTAYDLQTDGQTEVVYAKLQPYMQATMMKGKYNKLSAKFFGPYKVIAKIGKVAYGLALPWENEGKDDATWELLSDMESRFPQFSWDT